MAFLLTLHLQRSLGMSPLEAGFAFLPYGAFAIGCARLAAPLVERTSARMVAVSATLAMTAGLVLLAAIPPDGGYVTRILPALALLASGNGLFSVAVGIAAMRGIREADSGLAGGLLNMSAQLGGAIGLAIAVSAFTATRDGAGVVAATRAGFVVLRGARPRRDRDLVRRAAAAERWLRRVATTDGHSTARPLNRSKL